MQEESARLPSSYYTTFTPNAKKLLSSALFSEFHITGIYFGPTVEAHINAQIPSAELPFTLAHEVAHAKGIMREEDANLTALYLCLTSKYDILRYSAYFSCFPSLIDIYYKSNYAAFLKVQQSYPSSLRLDYQTSYDFWQSHKLLSDFAASWNNFYLKLFGDKKGTDSYIDSSENESTGTYDEYDKEIFIITTYSPYQKLFFANYIEKSR